MASYHKHRGPTVAGSGGRKNRWRRILDSHPRCYYCDRAMVGEKETGAQVTTDHLLPRAHGGTDDPENLVYCCRRCNELKGDLTEDQFRALWDMTELPAWPGAMTAYRTKMRQIRVHASTTTPIHSTMSKARAQLALVGHDVGIPQRVKERAGFDRGAMGLAGAATATLGEILKAKT